MDLLTGSQKCSEWLQIVGLTPTQLLDILEAEGMKAPITALPNLTPTLLLDILEDKDVKAPITALLITDLQLMLRLRDPVERNSGGVCALKEATPSRSYVSSSAHSYDRRPVNQVACSLLTRDLPRAWDRITAVHKQCRLSKDPVLTRLQFQEQVSYSIPSLEALHMIMHTVGNKEQILSIATGRGCWEFLLQTLFEAAGGDEPDIVASDITIPSERFFYGTYVQMEASAAVLAHPEANVLLTSWSEGQGDDETFACEALELFRGRFVVSIGETDGCTGQVGLVLAGSAIWKEVARVEIPQWPDLHDDLKIYERVTDGDSA